MNGSSATGNCASISSSTSRPALCTDPTSSVLFDGHIPTLTGLDGDMWASQLLTIQKTASNTDIISYFTNFVAVVRVEIVMFNCPQWGAGVQTIQTYEQSTKVLAVNVDSTIISCDSLVRVCLPVRNTISTFGLRFLSLDSDWVHLAEVTFWGNNSTCPPDIVITSPPTPPPFTSTSQESELTTENTLPRSMDTTVIAVVIVLILLLLVLVGVVVVVLVLWRCRHQHTAKEEASHTSSQTHTPQAPLVSQDTDQDNPSNVYSSLTAQSEKKGAQSHTETQEYSVLHHGEQPLEKKKSVNLAVRNPAGRQEEEYSTLNHGKKPIQRAAGTGDTSFYDTIEQKHQVKTKDAKGT